ncbi:MAG: SDH family Clp fold serine proteinase [bacterium]
MDFSSAIMPDDIAYFQEMLYKIPYETPILLILYSNGGDLDTADNILKLIRNFTKDKSFIVIIPERAKSAATLLCLGSDEIIMGDTSELGPIDPFIIIYTRSGIVWRSAQDIIDMIEEINKNGLLPAYIPLLENYDIATVIGARKAIERAKTCANGWLSNYMCKGNISHVDCNLDKKSATCFNSNNIYCNLANHIACNLGDANIWLSHGHGINYKKAKELGLNIKYLNKENSLWDKIWQLYISYFPERQFYNKIFESGEVYNPIKVQN